MALTDSLHHSSKHLFRRKDKIPWLRYVPNHEETDGGVKKKGCTHITRVPHSVGNTFPEAQKDMRKHRQTLSAKLISCVPTSSLRQSDTLTIPIIVLPEPDVPGVYLPQGGLMHTTEDADLAVEGLVIIERDGFYEEGEMKGEIVPPDLDAVDATGEAAAIGGTWPGEVRQRLVSTHLTHPTHKTYVHKCTYRVYKRNLVRS